MWWWGHGRLWPNRFWPKFGWPTLAKPTLANFSVSVFWPNFLNPKSPNPKDPNPYLGERAELSWPHPSGSTFSGFRVVVVVARPLLPPLDRPKFCASFPLLHFRSFWDLSGCRVKPRRPQSRRGFTRQPENSKRAHLRVPAFNHTTKIPREDTQRDTKRAKWWREREKKARNCGLPTLRGPTLQGPIFLGLGAPLRT